MKSKSEQSNIYLNLTSLGNFAWTTPFGKKPSNDQLVLASVFQFGFEFVISEVNRLSNLRHFEEELFWSLAVKVGSWN